MARRGERSTMRLGFTLIELLVVVAIIGLLLTIMLPSYMSIQERAHRTGCQNNHHELIRGVAAYAAANRNFVTFPNWRSLDDLMSPGWLYDAHDLSQGGSPYVQADLEKSSLWPYLGNHQTYRCPGEDTPYNRGPSNAITSYLMNGAVVDYGRTYPPGSSTYARFRILDIIAFVGNDAVLIWEAQEDWGAYWNDGSSSPNQGLTHRHGDGATVGCIGGHTDWITQAQYQAELTHTPGRLWCNPAQPTGN